MCRLTTFTSPTPPSCRRPAGADAPAARAAPHATAPLWQVATAVNVLLVLESHDARSAPFVLHTLKGARLIVGAGAALVILLVGGP
jgi:hypothetical protein